MTFGQLLHTFFSDDKLKAVIVLITLDFALGAIAAVKLKTFRFSYIADLARNDVLFKVVPWFVIYSGALVAGQQSIIISGVTIGTVAGALYALVVAALGGSIASSLLELGLGQGLGATVKQLFGGENPAPHG